MKYISPTGPDMDQREFLGRTIFDFTYPDHELTLARSIVDEQDSALRNEYVYCIPSREK